jgi:hypothetical protein
MKNLLRSRLVLGATVFVLIGAITYACSDFLDTPSQGTLDETSLQTKEGIEGSLISAYRTLDCTSSSGAWGCAASNWVFGDITSDDAYKGSEATDQPGATQIELYNWTLGQAPDYLDQKWGTVYEGVVRANATLRLLYSLMKSKPGELTAADSMGIEGEALFLRAHYHFEAWRMWGNVPYYFENDADPRKANDLGSAAVAANIIADLNRAIADLGPTPRKGEVGRATSWTARAYKGRVFVYTNQWDSARVTLDAIRTGGPYALETSFDHVWTAFQDLKNGKETIFAYEASSNDGEPSGWNANWGETLNFPHSGSPFGCCGFHQPSQNLANAYAVDGVTGLPKAFVSPATFNNRDSTWVASASDTVDPRLDWTIGRDNVPYKDWGLHRAGWIRAPGYGGRYSPKKNAHENASGSQSQVGWNATQLNSVHIHLFRYADLLLMLAEAEAHAGGAAGLVNANTIVNQIRARAGVTAQGCGGAASLSADTLLFTTYPKCKGDKRLAVAINDTSIGWATYKVSPYPAFADTGTALTAIRLERRLELGMEGQRFFDLRRYGEAYATSVINTYLNVEKNRRTYKTAQVPFGPRYMLFPIPPIQIDLSKIGTDERLTQNPGW